jgi:hypothetical protein
MRRSLIALTILLHGATSHATPENGLHVAVEREGDRYHLSATLPTTLSECAAWRYLTDYDAAVQLPGVISSTSHRESDNKVTVKRVADERILFLHINLRSVMEFTEFPMTRLTFTQIEGDSKSFHGEWRIESGTDGSTLHFSGVWEPDTLLPLFIIDHFAEHDLERRFAEISRLAEGLKARHSAGCQP